MACLKSTAIAKSSARTILDRQAAVVRLETGAQLTSIKDELLIEGLQDEVSVAWVYSVTRARHPSSPEVLRQLSIGIVAELLAEELMVAGDLVDDGSCVVVRPWTESPGSAIVRIARAWVADWPDTKPDLNSIAYLVSTDSGRIAGEAALARSEQ